MGWSLWINRCGFVVVGDSLWTSCYGSVGPCGGRLSWVCCCRLVVVRTSSSGSVAGVGRCGSTAWGQSL